MRPIRHIGREHTASPGWPLSGLDGQWLLLAESDCRTYQRVKSKLPGSFYCGTNIGMPGQPPSALRIAEAKPTSNTVRPRSLRISPWLPSFRPRSSR